MLRFIGAVLGVAAATALAQPDTSVFSFDVTPGVNDGRVVYRLTVPADVPVDGFWSVTVYGPESRQDDAPYAPSVNGVNAQKSRDGSVAIQFGGCGDKTPNCLPIVSGWSYTVRLYRPRAEVLDGRWKFPPPVQRGDHFGRGLRG